MRLKMDTLVRNSRGKLVHVWRLFASTRVNQMLVIPEARQMWGMELFLSGCYLGSGEYLILVSAEHSPEPHQEYKKRWGIETLFGALKSRGFNLEETHLKDPERLSRLLALLALAFTLAGSGETGWDVGADLCVCPGLVCQPLQGRHSGLPLR